MARPRAARAEGLLDKCADLEKIIPEPKPRSKTWLSTCYALDDGSADADMCGVGYQVSPPSSSIRPHIHGLPKLYGLIESCGDSMQAHPWHNIAG